MCLGFMPKKRSHNTYPFYNSKNTNIYKGLSFTFIMAKDVCTRRDFNNIAAGTLLGLLGLGTGLSSGYNHAKDTYKFNMQEVTPELMILYNYNNKYLGYIQRLFPQFATDFNIIRATMNDAILDYTSDISKSGIVNPTVKIPSNHSIEDAVNEMVKTYGNAVFLEKDYYSYIFNRMKHANQIERSYNLDAYLDFRDLRSELHEPKIDNPGISNSMNVEEALYMLAQNPNIGVYIACEALELAPTATRINMPYVMPPDNFECVVTIAPMRMLGNGRLTLLNMELAEGPLEKFLSGRVIVPAVTGRKITS